MVDLNGNDDNPSNLDNKNNSNSVKGSSERAFVKNIGHKHGNALIEQHPVVYQVVPSEFNVADVFKHTHGEQSIVNKNELYKKLKITSHPDMSQAKIEKKA